MINRDRQTKLQAQVRRIVRTGKCPECGGPIHRNCGLKGWYQCDRYDAATSPQCKWQGFTC